MIGKKRKWKLPNCPGCKHHPSAHRWTPVEGAPPKDSIHGPCVVPGCECKVYVDPRPIPEGRC
jgi:hypothetical protein